MGGTWVRSEGPDLPEPSRRDKSRWDLWDQAPGLGAGRGRSEPDVGTFGVRGGKSGTMRGSWEGQEDSGGSKR